MTKTRDDWRRMEREADTLLREGRGDEARIKLKKIRLSAVPRPQLASFAKLFRRCNLWESSLSALKPVIYPKVSGKNTATPEERVEYAMALRRAGAFHEALRILGDMSLSDDVTAVLAQAQIYMVQWDYARALPLLNQVVARGGRDPYETLVARVNRLACMSFLEDDGFGAETVDLERDLRKQKHFLLLSNVEEIAAHRLISDEHFDEAFKRLKSAEKMLQDDGGPYAGLIQKWLRIGQAMKKRSVPDLLEHRAQALKRSDWETLRHLDYFVTRLEPDSIRSNRVYYGTPYVSFREKLEAIRPFEAEAWIRHAPESEVEFDPWFPGHDEGEFIHRVLVLFLRDWYRPVSLGGIFDQLYPGEHFDLRTSALRVRQHVMRLKIWLGKFDVPLRVVQAQGQYGLRTTARAKILMRKRFLSFDKSGFIFGRYVGRVPQVQDSADWRKILKMSSRQTLYLLNQAIDDGWIAKVQKGRYLKYRLTPPA